MRLHLIHQDTSLALITEEYRRERGYDGPLAEEQLAEIHTIWNETLEHLVPRMVSITIDAVRSPARANARAHAQMRIVAEMEQRWGTAFQLLTDLIETVKELVDRFLIRIQHTPPEDVHHLHRARTIIGVRAIQTALGIQELLRSGMGSAAWALWRTLHELAVVAKFISKHGEETARAYLEHGCEQSYRTLNEYKKHHKNLADSPELETLLEQHREWKKILEAPDRHGPGFGATYGWAGAALKNKRPAFADLEKDVEMSVARPEYQVASNVVHPGVRGFLDHHRSGSGHPAEKPWSPSAELLGWPLEVTAKTLTALTGGMADFWSPASDWALLGAAIQLRDELLRAIPPLDKSRAPADDSTAPADED